VFGVYLGMDLNLNQIGLILDIAGVVLLFVNGLAFHFSNTFSYLLMKNDEEFRKKDDFKKIKKRYRIMSALYYLGILFIITGFVFQFLGTPSPQVFEVCCEFCHC